MVRKIWHGLSEACSRLHVLWPWGARVRASLNTNCGTTSAAVVPVPSSIFRMSARSSCSQRPWLPGPPSWPTGSCSDLAGDCTCNAPGMPTTKRTTRPVATSATGGHSLQLSVLCATGLHPGHSLFGARTHIVAGVQCRLLHLTLPVVPDSHMGAPVLFVVDLLVLGADGGTIGSAGGCRRLQVVQGVVAGDRR